MFNHQQPVKSFNNIPYVSFDHIFLCRKKLKVPYNRDTSNRKKIGMLKCLQLDRKDTSCLDIQEHVFPRSFSLVCHNKLQLKIVPTSIGQLVLISCKSCMM